MDFIYLEIDNTVHVINRDRILRMKYCKGKTEIQIVFDSNGEDGGYNYNMTLKACQNPSLEAFKILSKLTQNGDESEE